MSNKLFVRNVPFSMSETELQGLFSQVGTVLSVKMPLDRETGRKRGFAFIEMENQDEAKQAIEKLNNYYVNGREIAVDYSRENRQAA